MMATQDELAAVRDDIAEVKREVLLVRRDQQAHEERVEARFTLMEARFELTDERMEVGFALVDERIKAWAQELRAHFETEIRRAITVQTLIQTATMVGLVWAARG